MKRTTKKHAAVKSLGQVDPREIHQVRPRIFKTQGVWHVDDSNNVFPCSSKREAEKRALYLAAIPRCSYIDCPRPIWKESPLGLCSKHTLAAAEQLNWGRLAEQLHNEYEAERSKNLTDYATATRRRLGK